MPGTSAAWTPFSSPRASHPKARRRKSHWPKSRSTSAPTRSSPSRTSSSPCVKAPADKGTDGNEQAIEAGFSRYSVIFTGREFPDGRKADAVYLILNDVYLKVLNEVQTRPLDYDYLRDLPPAAQRFYELLGIS